MRLARVQIKNHTRLRDLDIEIRRHAVLIGPNNSGKSALLRLIGATLAPSLSGLYRQLGTPDIRDPEDSMSVELTFCDLSSSDLTTYNDSVVVTANPNSRYELGIILQVDVDVDDPASVTIRRSFSGPAPNRPARQQMEALGWRFLPAMRSLSGDSLEGRGSVFRDLLSQVDLGQDKAHLRAMLEAFDSTLGKNSTVAQLRASLALHLAAAMPRKIVPEDLSLHSSGLEMDDVLGTVSLSLRNAEGVQQSLSEQSDGSRSLIAMTFYDYSATTAGIVAIDEPENHLHPSAQRAVAELLRKGENQKLIATHSTSFVQKFDPEEVIAFDSGGHARAIATGYLTRQEKMIAQWWITARLEPLTAQFVLLVEGDSDRIFLEQAAKRLSVQLDRLGICIFDLGGSGEFGHAYKLFGPNGFGIGLAGLVDADAEDTWARAMGVPTTDLFSHNVVVCREDLEVEYFKGLGSARIRAIFDESGFFSGSDLQDLPTNPLDHPGIKKWFKGRGRKVRAALALGSSLTRTEFMRVDAVKSLISFLR